MAFGKKGKKDDEAPHTAASAETAEEGDELSSSMFAGEEAAEEDDAITAGLLAEEKAAASADPLGGDLLNMFQTTQIEQDDLSVILELAGEVDLDDLLEELHTVAAALGCNAGEEFAAA
jgi:hypothetical protein